MSELLRCDHCGVTKALPHWEEDDDWFVFSRASDEKEVAGLKMGNRKEFKLDLCSIECANQKLGSLTKNEVEEASYICRTY